MKKSGILFIIILILSSCSNNSNEKNGNSSSKKQSDKMSLILGKWEVTDGNPIIQGTFISNYSNDNTFQQNGSIISFQPNYDCEATANGTFSISNDTISFEFLGEKLSNCIPEEYQLLVNSFMKTKELEKGKSKIISIDDKQMIQENIATKKRLTFTRVVE